MEDLLTVQREEVLTAEYALYEAIKKGNVAQLNALMHDDLLALLPSGELLTKEADLNAHRSRAMVVDDARMEIEKISLFDQTAVTLVQMQVSGKMMGENVQGRFRYMRVWQRQHGNLHLIAANILKLQ